MVYYEGHTALIVATKLRNLETMKVLLTHTKIELILKHPTLNLEFGKQKFGVFGTSINSSKDTCSDVCQMFFAF